MICKNMSEHYIINNYSVVEYYFLPVLIGVWCICCDIFAYRKSDGKCTIAKMIFQRLEQQADTTYVTKNNVALRCYNKKR